MHLTRIGSAFGEVEVLEAVQTTHVFRPHWHSTWSVGLADDGTHELHYRGRDFSVTPASCVIIPAFQVHSAAPIDARPWSYRMIYLPHAVFSVVPRLRDVLESPVSPLEEPVHQCAALREAVHQTWRSACAQDGDVDAALRRLAHALADVVARSGRSHRESKELHPATRAVRQYLEGRQTEIVRLTTLARLVDLSPFHLLRVFRRDTGMTPGEYWRQLRIGRAQQMLRDGVPISVTAFASGFSDQPHLTRSFKSVFGVTPAAYARI
jgi:AraC-like DNA-binding protein